MTIANTMSVVFMTAIIHIILSLQKFALDSFVVAHPVSILLQLVICRPSNYLAMNEHVVRVLGVLTDAVHL